MSQVICSREKILKRKTSFKIRQLDKVGSRGRCLQIVQIELGAGQAILA